MIRRLMLSSIAVFALAGATGCEQEQDDPIAPSNYDLDSPEIPGFNPQPAPADLPPKNKDTDKQDDP